MFVRYSGLVPLHQYATLEEAPQGELLYYFPEPNHPVPVLRAGSRLLYPEPDGVYRYWATYEAPTRFALPEAEGDALVVFYDPLGKAFGLEVYMGRRLQAREVLHKGEMAREAFLALFGR